MGYAAWALLHAVKTLVGWNIGLPGARRADGGLAVVRRAAAKRGGARADEAN